MSFILCLLDFLLLAVVLVDTLGFIVQNRKNPSSSNQQEYHRLCFTWVFYSVIKSLTCSTCTGMIGSFLCLLFLLVKAYISLPILNGTEKLYTVLIEQNAGRQYIEGLVNTLKQKMAGKTQ